MRKPRSLPGSMVFRSTRLPVDDVEPKPVWHVGSDVREPISNPDQGLDRLRDSEGLGDVSRVKDLDWNGPRLVPDRSVGAADARQKHQQPLR